MTSKYLIIRDNKVFRTNLLETKDYILAKNKDIIIISLETSYVFYGSNFWLDPEEWKDNKLF